MFELLQWWFKLPSTEPSTHERRWWTNYLPYPRAIEGIDQREPQLVTCPSYPAMLNYSATQLRVYIVASLWGIERQNYAAFTKCYVLHICFGHPFVDGKQ